MSSRAKKCKTCGTTDVSLFAPRKSVICKNCDSTSNLPVVPEIEPILFQEPVPQVVESTTNTISTQELLKILTELEEKFNLQTQKTEETLKKLREEIDVLSRIKKLFPRSFPEENKV